jgi:chorismate lyase/3-hydroxybenzoate synthase
VDTGIIYENRDFHLLENDYQLLGVLVKPITYPLETQIYNIYLDILELTQNWNLCRIWNYVPYINEESRGLENYKSFCKGRSLAFEKFYGEDFEVKLPAGTGVGICEDTYVIYFAAIKENISNVENPQQVSAFSYPSKYGPRSPSFARGTVITNRGKRIGYLSGTASIKGHQSLGKGDIIKQFYITLDNMKLVFEQMGFDRNFLVPELYERHFTVYLRHLSDLPIVKEMVEQNFLPTDRFVYLHSDICRAELDIEIEATITEK